MREIVQRAAVSVDAQQRQSQLNHGLILVAHSARPVDLDGVIEDFVRFNDQRKDNFGLQTIHSNAKLSTLTMCQRMALLQCEGVTR